MDDCKPLVDGKSFTVEDAKPFTKDAWQSIMAGPTDASTSQLNLSRVGQSSTSHFNLSRWARHSSTYQLNL